MESTSSSDPTNRTLFGALCAIAVAVVFSIAVFAVYLSTPRVVGLSVQRLTFQDLPGWGGREAQTHFPLALAAFQRSCDHIQKRPPDDIFARRSKSALIQDLFGPVSVWQAICQQAATVASADADAAAFFQAAFTPVLINDDPDNRGLFTGYYEPEMSGSRAQTGDTQTPLYRTPDDLVMVNLGDFRDSLEGQRIAGRVTRGRLSPFEDRAQIEAGALPKDLVLAWLDDPVDAFFLHIQGSGRILLPSGEVMRVGYDAQNGHPYTAIGRTLIDMGALSRENVSMQSIRQWLGDNPDRAQSVMNENKSFVFFREIDVADPALGPLGAQGVSLTPHASLAVDRRYYPLGAPIWLALDDLDQPRLMIAQDTGGAISGVQRGDYFWGAGEDAAEQAGKMQAPGMMYALVPKALMSGN